MTPEEIAKKAFHSTPEAVRNGTIDYEDFIPVVAAVIRDAYEQAAQVAEIAVPGHYVAAIAAAAIRKRLKGDGT